MSLLNSKKYIEQYFFDNWSETSIHWSGTEFNTSGKIEWIAVKFSPIRVSSCGLNNDNSNIIGSIRVAVFANNEFRNYEILDMVIDLFSDKNVGSNFASDIRIISNSKTEDNMYYYSDVEIRTRTV